MSKTEVLYPSNTFGGRLQKRRLEMNLSRPALYDMVKSDNMDVDEKSKSKTIKNWESGKFQPSQTDLKKICKVLSCSLDYLFGINPEKSHVIKHISEHTGLTPISVDTLHRNKKLAESKIESFAFDSLADKIRKHTEIENAKKATYIVNLLIGNPALIDSLYKYLRSGSNGVRYAYIETTNYEQQHYIKQDEIQLIEINGVKISPEIINKAMQDQLVNVLNDIQSNNNIPHFGIYED